MACCCLLAPLNPRAFSQNAPADYKLAPQDVISVDVFNEKELSREQLRVSAKGEISFPLLEVVKVAGKTPVEVEEFLEEALGKDYLVNPHVTVTVKSYHVRTSVVLGAVNKAGAIELPSEREIDIVEAIAMAGGLAKEASEKRIEFTRHGETKVYRLDDLNKVKDPAKKIFVQPGDVINVRETRL